MNPFISNRGIQIVVSFTVHSEVVLLTVSEGTISKDNVDRVTKKEGRKGVGNTEDSVVAATQGLKEYTS